MNKKPITQYQIFCADCDKKIGIVKTIPQHFPFEDKIRYSKQKYQYLIEKYRKGGYTYFVTRTFCSKECKKIYAKKHFK